MKVIRKEESRERCAESGWFAWDLILDGPMDQEFILSLKPLGAFSYLPMLKKPFFKVESDYFFLKGVQGDDFLRAAIHRPSGKTGTDRKTHRRDLIHKP